MGTYGGFLVALVLHFNIRLAILAKQLEGETLQVGLHLRISKLATNKMFGIENGALLT
jgi:hypothetical protein